MVILPVSDPSFRLYGRVVEGYDVSGVLDALMQASEEELTAIDDIGAVTAQYLRSWLASGQSQDLIRKLKDAGVNMNCLEQETDEKFTFEEELALLQGIFEEDE